MNRISRLLGIASMLGAFVDDGPRAPRLGVEAIIAPGPYYVGQAIEARVEVGGATGRAEIEPPRVQGASIRPLSADEHRPSTARFVVIPERPGALVLGPFRARWGDRSGTSRPSRLEASNVPSVGRPSAFLGGVGPFQVRAEAEPSRLRPGQSLEYRLRVSGPAAWGSIRAPDLSGWASLKPQFRVDPLPDVMEDADGPVRTFRYRLRPVKAGDVVLPPVSVAAFDAGAGRYATRATAGLPIRVEEPPRFDPAGLDDGSVVAPPGGRQVGRIAVGLGLLAVALAGLGLGLGLGLRIYSKRARVGRRDDPGGLARELARGLAAEGDGLESARAVSEALATFLERAAGRPSGVLTPLEAGEGVGYLTGDRDLGRSAHDLVGRCDRARFGRPVDAAPGLLDECRGLLEGIADVMGRRGRRAAGPREAVETARDRRGRSGTASH